MPCAASSSMSVRERVVYAALASARSCWVWGLFSRVTVRCWRMWLTHVVAALRRALEALSGGRVGGDEGDAGDRGRGIWTLIKSAPDRSLEVGVAWW